MINNSHSCHVEAPTSSQVCEVATQVAETYTEAYSYVYVAIGWICYNNKLEE